MSTDDRDGVEACGRCAMTTVVDAVGDENRTGRDPFEDGRIEVPERELRAISAPQVFLGRMKRRLDEFATRLTYGR